MKASKYKAKLNFLQREAILIGEISNFDYLLEFKNSLKIKKESIKKTIDAIKEGVRVGRVTEFKLIRLKDELLNIDMEIKKVDSLIATSKANIYKLTKLKPTTKIPIHSNIPKSGEFFELKPIKSEIEAMKYEIKAAKDKFLPKVFFKADGYRAFGEGDADSFGSVGVYLTWEIFNKKNLASVQKAKIKYLKSELSFDKNLKDLIAKKDEILKRIDNLNASIKMAKKSLRIKRELLKSAKVAFELDEMSVDEYLGYENELAKARATLASLIAKKNMLIAQLAFMYGENFKKVFK
ncbi:MAG: TolC family protein [Nautiliaceae bacterium]